LGKACWLESLVIFHTKSTGDAVAGLTAVAGGCVAVGWGTVGGTMVGAGAIVGAMVGAGEQPTATTKSVRTIALMKTRRAIIIVFSSFESDFQQTILMRLHFESRVNSLILDSTCYHTA
jgi:hypothetical protein